MQHKYDISAYMTSIRPYRWMGIHEMLSKTNLNFEIVIVGPIEADFELPPEIKFYHSSVKPCQCQHAAASLSIGDVLFQIVDDMEYQDGSIEAMYNLVNSNLKVMSTCRYLMDGSDKSSEQNIAGCPRSDLPILPVCGMFRRSEYEFVGGIDKSFDGVMGELDLYMRLFTDANLNTQFVDFTCNENRQAQNSEGSGLCDKFCGKDRPVFIDLWSQNGNLSSTRNRELSPYSKENLLTENQ